MLDCAARPGADCLPRRSGDRAGEAIRLARNRQANTKAGSEASTRAHLRRELEAHLNRLGYTGTRMLRGATRQAEVARVSPVRGTIVYGQTVLHGDLRRRECHEDLLFFSKRRTRHRSSIPFFIGVAEADRDALEALLQDLGIRSGVRGGHVQVVAIPDRDPQRAKPVRGTRG